MSPAADHASPVTLLCLGRCSATRCRVDSWPGRDSCSPGYAPGVWPFAVWLLPAVPEPFPARHPHVPSGEWSGLDRFHRVIGWPVQVRRRTCCCGPVGDSSVVRPRKASACCHPCADASPRLAKSVVRLASLGRLLGAGGAWPHWREPDPGCPGRAGVLLLARQPKRPVPTPGLRPIAAVRLGSWAFNAVGKPYPVSAEVGCLPVRAKGHFVCGPGPRLPWAFPLAGLPATGRRPHPLRPRHHGGVNPRPHLCVCARSNRTQHHRPPESWSDRPEPWLLGNGRLGDSYPLLVLLGDTR